MVDLAVSASIPILGVWLYELSNLVVLASQGCSVSLSMLGWIPLGVAGVSTGSLSPVSKLAQVTLASVPLAVFGKLLSKVDLRMAEAFSISFVGVYFASMYWEMLSLLTTLPMVVHAGVFVTGTGCLLAFLLRMVKFDRPRQVNKTTMGALASRA
jgi:hypothetical protein